MGKKRKILRFFTNRGGTANFKKMNSSPNKPFLIIGLFGFYYFYEKGDNYGTFNPSNKRYRRCFTDR